MFIQDIFPSWLYVCCTYMPTSSTGKKISARIKSQTYFSFFRSLSILCPELNSVLFAATAKSSYRWGYRGCQDGQRIGIEFAELARTDHDLVTFAIEGTVYLWSPVDLMTLATATANATGEQTCTRYPSLLMSVYIYTRLIVCYRLKSVRLLNGDCSYWSDVTLPGDKSDTILWSGYAADYYLEEKHLWSPMSFMFFS